MESETIFRIELKYCECCGGLFFRRENTPSVFCATCKPIMDKVAVARKRPPQSVKAVAVFREAACV